MQKKISSLMLVLSTSYVFFGLIALIALKWKFCVHSIIFYYSQHHIWLRSSSCSTVLQIVHQRPRLAMDPTPPLTLLTPSRQNPDCLYTNRPILVIDPFPPFTLFTLIILSPAWLHPQSCVASPSMLSQGVHTNSLLLPLLHRQCGL